MKHAPVFAFLLLFATTAQAENVQYKFDKWTVICEKGTHNCRAWTGGYDVDDPKQRAVVEFYPGKKHKIIIRVPPTAKAHRTIAVREGDRPNGILYMKKDSCNEKECAVVWSATPHDIRVLGMVDEFTVEYAETQANGHALFLSMDGFNEAFFKMRSILVRKP